jgi:hypothetical protein
LRIHAAAATVAILMFAAPTASAAPWKRLTAPEGRTIDQVALARSADGVLHVAWHHPTGPLTEDLLHTSIAADGSVGATVPIATGWVGIQNPALVTAPDGLRAIWGGIRSTVSGDPQNEMSTALSTDGGATWVLQPGSVVRTGGQSYGSSVSAVTRPDGTSLQAWAGTLGTWVHAGLTGALPNHDFQAGLGTYGYDPALAVDAAGRVVLAWYSSAAGRLGVLAQDVSADGSPVGGPVTMPGTSDMAIGLIARTPLVARPGGGFYAAYPVGYPALEHARLWRVGAPESKSIASFGALGNHPVTVAAAADGRLWVLWLDGDRAARPRMFARRSNPAATRFGAVVDAGRPRGASSGYRLDASAAGGALDGFGVFTLGADSSAATYYRRILPGLSIGAAPSTLRRGESRGIRFTVSDAGDPVRGATVRVSGRSGRTRADGSVRLRVTGRARLRARATLRGYVPASVRLRLSR